MSKPIMTTFSSEELTQVFEIFLGEPLTKPSLDESLKYMHDPAKSLFFLDEDASWKGS